MSIKLMTTIFDAVMDPNEKLVMLALADYASDDGKGIYPSQETLAGKTGFSDRNIRTVLKKLAASGLVIKGKRTKYNTLNYTINVEVLSGLPKHKAENLAAETGKDFRFKPEDSSDDPLVNHQEPKPSRKRGEKPPKPPKPPKPEPKKREPNPTFDAIAQVCGPQDPELFKSYVKENGGWIGKIASNGAGRVPAEKIIEWYSPGGWWYSVRCKGLSEIPKPTPDSIKKTVELAEEWDKSKNVHLSVDQQRQIIAERNARARAAQLQQRGAR